MKLSDLPPGVSVFNEHINPSDEKPIRYVTDAEAEEFLSLFRLEVLHAERQRWVDTRAALLEGIDGVPASYWGVPFVDSLRALAARVRGKA